MRFLAPAVLIAYTASAWNGTGHRVIARIAYDHLKPEVRTKVDAALARHPDFAKWVGSAPADPAERARLAFEHAANWPDDIRNDPRFHGDTGTPTPTLPGFPEMNRHTNWHFTNVPIATDGTSVKGRRAPEPNVLIKLDEIRRTFRGSSAEMQTYLIPWLLHLVGDVHQPLHAVARFHSISPDGDRGGNGVALPGKSNLHSFWDAQLGTGQSNAFVAARATALVNGHGRTGAARAVPKTWVKESVAAAKADVYNFTGGTAQNPAVLSEAYEKRAKEVAAVRGALAGYRLAHQLNQLFR
ncbi:MAG: S1/P1 nuclease [Acidobacteria bacterium]|nr:S1/P1 nuclease [Acidobacteriota bacterium]